LISEANLSSTPVTQIKMLESKWGFDFKSFIFEVVQKKLLSLLDSNFGQFKVWILETRVIVSKMIAKRDVFWICIFGR
jgi:hypothetical protein